MLGALFVRPWSRSRYSFSDLAAWYNSAIGKEVIWVRAKQLQGILLASIGAILWGVSGPIAQWLFTTRHMSLIWLIESKMLLSGLILLLVAALLPKERRRLFALWHSWRSILALVVFTV